MMDIHIYIYTHIVNLLHFTDIGKIELRIVFDDFC